MKASFLNFFRFKRAIECNCQISPKITITSVVVVVFPVLTTIFTFFDRLTPTFAGVLNFRFRIITAITLSGILLLLARKIIFAKHLAPGLLPDSEFLHYSYGNIERITTKIISVLLLFTLGISASDLRFCFGQTGSLQGVVTGSNGIPIERAVVNIVNLDKKSVCIESAETDSNGYFILDITSHKGRAAYFYLSSKDNNCTSIERLPFNATRLLATPQFNIPREKVTLVSNCPTGSVVTFGGEDSEKLSSERAQNIVSPRLPPQSTEDEDIEESETLPWKIKMMLDPKFPTNSRADLQVDTIYPAKVESNLSGNLLTVKPKLHSSLKPTHAVIRVGAFGFQEKVLNTGILSYAENKIPTAFKDISFDLKPYDLPIVENVIRLKEPLAFELAIFNPTSTEISITKIAIRGSYLSRECVSVTDDYDIMLRVIGDTITGKAKRVAAKGRFIYPVVGDFGSSSCGSHLTVEIPTNQTIPAKERLLLRLFIHEGERILRDRSERSSKLDMKIRRKIFTHPILQENPFGWSFNICINNRLWLMSGYI